MPRPRNNNNIRRNGLYGYNPEFPPFGTAVPYEMQAIGTRAQFEEFLRLNPDLSAEDKAYVQRRIRDEIFYEEFKKTLRVPVTKAPVTEKNGRIILDSIHLRQGQSTGMGCYSCSFQLLLQSRGIDLTQEQIRAYRPRGEFFDTESQERMMGDHIGSVLDIGGLAVNHIKNTAVCEKLFSVGDSFFNHPASPEDKERVYQEMRATILESLTVHHSPLSVLVPIHYRTIVGYDPKTDELILKNSMNHSRPDAEERQTLRGLIGSSRQISLTYLMTIDPMNPTANLEKFEGVEYINGHYVQNSENNLNLPASKLDAEGSNFTYNQNLGTCSVSGTVKLPNELHPTPEMERAGIRNVPTPVIQTVQGSEEKKALLRELDSRMNHIIPLNSELMVEGNVNNPTFRYRLPDGKGGYNVKTVPKDKGLEFFYYNGVKKGLANLTPWQTKHAIDPARVQFTVDFYKGGADTFLQSFLSFSGRFIPAGDFAPDVEVSPDPNHEMISNFFVPPCHLAGNHDAGKIDRDLERMRKNPVKSHQKAEPLPKKEVIDARPEKKAPGVAPEKKAKAAAPEKGTKAAAPKNKAEGASAGKEAADMIYMKEVVRNIPVKGFYNDPDDSEFDFDVYADADLGVKGRDERIHDPEKYIPSEMEKVANYSIRELFNERHALQEKMKNGEVSDEETARFIAVTDTMINKGVESSLDTPEMYEENRTDVIKKLTDMENNAIKSSLKNKDIDGLAEAISMHYFVTSLKGKADTMSQSEFYKLTRPEAVKKFVSEGAGSIRESMDLMIKDKKQADILSKAIKSKKIDRIEMAIGKFNSMRTIGKADEKAAEEIGRKVEEKTGKIEEKSAPVKLV